MVHVTFSSVTSINHGEFGVEMLKFIHLQHVEVQIWDSNVYQFAIHSSYRIFVRLPSIDNSQFSLMGSLISLLLVFEFDHVGIWIEYFWVTSNLIPNLVISTPWILIFQILPLIMSVSWFTFSWFLLWSLREKQWMCGGLWNSVVVLLHDFMISTLDFESWIWFLLYVGLVWELYLHLPDFGLGLTMCGWLWKHLIVDNISWSNLLLILPLPCCLRSQKLVNLHGFLNPWNLSLLIISFFNPLWASWFILLVPREDVLWFIFSIGARDGFGWLSFLFRESTCGFG